MSTASASSYDLSSNPMKRKRGRPRKEQVSRSESNRRVLRSPSSSAGLVGQEISGFFVGVFDAGYLLTVQVGSSGPVMNGLVFDPCHAVPISAENDVAPHLPMLRRNEPSPPIEEDFFNRGVVSSQVDTVEKSLTESLVPQAASETMRPTKTLRIFLEGAAAESSSHLQAQVKNDDTSNGYNPSVVSMTSSEASKDVPADISKETVLVSVSKIPDASVATPHASSSVPLSIVKEAPYSSTEGLPFDVEPSVVFKSLEASAASRMVNLDESSPEEDFEVRHVSERRTEETGGIAGEDLYQKLDKPSNVREVNDSLAGYNGISEIPMGDKPRTAITEKFEDCHTASEASTFQP